MFFAELSFCALTNHEGIASQFNCLVISHSKHTDQYLTNIVSSLSITPLLDLIASGDPLYISNHEFADVDLSSSFRIIFNIPWKSSASSTVSESSLLAHVRSFSPHRRSFQTISDSPLESVPFLDLIITRPSSISLDSLPNQQVDSCTYFDSVGRLSIYGFEKEADISRPPYLMFDYTNICNAKCIHCPQSVGFEGQNRKGNLTLDSIQSSLESVASQPPEIIRITGDGEPLMNPIFFPSLDLISSYKLNRITAITTNGSLLSQKAIDQLIEFNPMLIDISIDAFSEQVYSVVRVGLNFATVISNVLKLISARNSDPSCSTKIIVSFVQQDANSHEVDDFRNYWAGKADDVLIREMISNVGKTATALPTNGSNRWPCVHWFRRSVVVYDSSVKSCPIDWDSKTKVSETCSPSLLPIWQNSVYNQARFNHIFEEIPDDHICRSCVDWQGTPWDKGYVQFIQDHLTKEE
tara:strand:- start:3053 stop:4453 length:1401 start_codon:yes stop_codon:yes gene_type:complete